MKQKKKQGVLSSHDTTIEICLWADGPQIRGSGFAEYGTGMRRFQEGILHNHKFTTAVPSNGFQPQVITAITEFASTLQGRLWLSHTRAAPARERPADPFLTSRRGMLGTPCGPTPVP